MIVWINGTHGVGKTTTSALVARAIPDSRVFDAEKVGEVLMDITPGLPETDNFQHWRKHLAAHNRRRHRHVGPSGGGRRSTGRGGRGVTDSRQSNQETS